MVEATFGFSHMGLYRFMKLHTGSTFRAYVGSAKMARAMMLLRQTNKTVNEIAVEVGFSNGVCFARFFRAQMLMSPTTWRRIVREDANKQA